MAIGVGDVVRASAIIKDQRLADVINTYDLEVMAAGTGGNDGFKVAVHEWLVQLYTNIGSILHGTAAGTAIGFYQRNGLEVLTPIAWAAPTFTAGGEELPYGTSILVYARTSQRHVISRKFLGPIGTFTVNDGKLNSAANTSLEGFINDWLDPFTSTEGWDLQAVVWPRTNTGSVPLVEGVISPFLAIQRRRRAGRGS